MNEPLPYRGNLTWLRDRTILCVTHGSTAYGLNTPTSDLDIKGVTIPPAEYFLGYANTFEQAISSEPDMAIYDIRKFFRLAAECNPNIIEVLWCDELDHRIITPAGRRMLDARDLFISKKARHTFSGYAMSQLKRIQGHYRWLKSPPKAEPTRAEFGLPERTVIPADQLAAAHAAVTKKLGSWHLDDMSGLEPADRIRLQSLVVEMLAELKITVDDQYQAAGRAIGYEENFLRLLDLERQYKGRRTEWDQYQNWLATRNPARADLEAKWGFDTKHAMHLVRLMRMCREILETGKVVVRRPDRDELLAIRNGAWSYEYLIEWAQKQDEEIATEYDSSPLRHHPDRKALDQLCREIVEESLR